MYEIDIEKVREKIIDYYGTAMFNGFFMAMFDLEKVKRMSDEEVIEEAEKLGII